MQIDHGASRLGPRIVVRHHNGRIAEKLGEEINRRWMRYQLGDCAACPLYVIVVLLLFGVVSALGGDSGKFVAQQGDVIWREQIRNDDISLDFQMLNPLPECKP